MTIAEIISAIKELAAAEKRIEELVGNIKEAIKNEQDAKKRKAIKDAFRGRDGDRLRELLFK